MSFDLMVFEKITVPKGFDEFLDWYSNETKWAENRNYNSLAGTSRQLAAWFMDMKRTFFAMNGEYALGDKEAFTS